jgi:eukaryotic-like serine/threonine-protein kinase
MSPGRRKDLTAEQDGAFSPSGTRPIAQRSGPEWAEPSREGNDEPTLVMPVPRAGRRAEWLGKNRVCFDFAAGGMCTVQLAVRRGSENFEKIVAIKRLLPEFANDPDFVAMLVDEARISSHAFHPFVREVFDFEQSDDGTHYMVMEFLVGEPLSTIFEVMSGSWRPTDLPRHAQIVARLVADLCAALHSVHELAQSPNEPLEVVHRDVSPQNLFVLHDGTVRLADFGVARAKGQRQRTKGKALKGKLAYMSPEYVAREPFDRRSDVWAIGVVLWELLTGRRLFRRATQPETIDAIIKDRVPLPSSVNGEIHPELDSIVMRALERSLPDRYPTAAALSDDLNAYLVRNGFQVSAGDIGKWLHEIAPESLPRLLHLIDLSRRIDAATDPEALAAQSPGVDTHAPGESDTLVESREEPARFARELLPIVITLATAAFALGWWLSRWTSS